MRAAPRPRAGRGPRVLFVTPTPGATGETLTALALG